MTVFALLHGGWHGAWAWDLLVPELAVRGHRTVTVDLPSEDPAAGAADYAAVVSAALSATLSANAASLLHEAEHRRSESGEEVVLVAHSLAGLVAPLVAAAAPVRHVVYLAAMLPVPGESVDDRARAGDRQTRRGLGRGQTVHADGATSWQPAAAVARLYPDSPPELARWAAARLRRQHWRLTAEPSPLTAWPDVPATYLHCAADQVIDDGWARRAVPELLGVEPVELPGDHSPFLARPAALADLLTGV